MKEMKTKEFTGVQEGYNIHIGLINEDVEFAHGEENKIVVEYEGKRDLDDFEITFENNTFTLKSPKGLNRSFFFNDSENHFCVTLPKGLNVDEFKLKEINGDVSLDDIDAKTFSIETNNGDINMNNLNLGTFRIGSINGDVKMTDVKAGEFKLSQVSGDMKMRNVHIEKDLDAHTISGDLDLEDVSCAECNLKTVSGDIEGKEFYPTSVSLSSVSGDISITNTDASKTIEIKHKKTVSGDIEIRIKK